MNLIEYYENMIKKADMDILDEYSRSYGPDMVGGALGALGGMGLGYMMGGRKGALAGGLGGGLLGYTKGKDFLPSKLDRDFDATKFQKEKPEEQQKLLRNNIAQFKPDNQKTRQNIVSISESLNDDLSGNIFNAMSDSSLPEKYTDANWTQWDVGSRNIGKSPLPKGYINDRRVLTDNSVYDTQSDITKHRIGLQSAILNKSLDEMLKNHEVKKEWETVQKWDNTKPFPTLKSELGYFDPNAVYNVSQYNPNTPNEFRDYWNEYFERAQEYYGKSN